MLSVSWICAAATISTTTQKAGNINSKYIHVPRHFFEVNTKFRQCKSPPLFSTCIKSVPPKSGQSPCPNTHFA